jgi:hypothetical protein
MQVDTIEKRMAKMRIKVFDHMLATRGAKYRAFLRYLRFFKYAACSPDRGKFLESYYALMRYLDDIVDGDALLPEGYANEVDYILAKIRFSENPIDPVDEVDDLMVHCFEVGHRFGEEFVTETSDILSSLLFDARRRQKWQIFPKAELERHFYLMDIRGTIRAVLKVFNDDADKFELLQPLGTSCRHQYDIEDIQSDLAVGYVNISKEECDMFGIHPDDLRGSLTPNIKLWLKHHARKGLELLAEHHRLERKGRFTSLEKAVFKVVYESPARHTFEKVLKSGA